MNLEEEDLSRELFPLSHYASNRKRLIKEAFTVLHGPRLESTIPPSLKGIDTTELKSLCLDELEKIDTLKIVDIIEGRIKPKSNASIAAAEAQDTEPPIPTKKRKTKAENISIPLSSLKKKIKKSLKATDEGALNVQIKLTKKKKEKKKKEKKATKKGTNESEVPETSASSNGKKKAKAKKAKKEKKTVKSDKRVKEAKPDPARPTSHTGERTLMELLELEYRAKAIKALLKFQGFKDAKIDHIFEDHPHKPESSQDQTKVIPVSSEQPTKVSASESQPAEVDVAKTTVQDLEPSLDTNGSALDAKNGPLIALAETTDASKPPEENSLNIDNVPAILPPTKKISERRCHMGERIDDDTLDYENPDDLEDVRSAGATTPNSTDTECSSESEVEAEIKHSDESAPDRSEDAETNHDGSIPSDVDDVSEEEEGEIAFENNSAGETSRHSTPPHLSPAYSDAGDFQITLRNSPSPVQSSCPSSPERNEDRPCEDESVENPDKQVSAESLSDGEIGTGQYEVEESEILVQDESRDTTNQVQPLSLPDDTTQLVIAPKPIINTVPEITKVESSKAEISEHCSNIGTVDKREVMDSEDEAQNKLDLRKLDDREDDEDADAIDIRNPTQYPDEATPVTWYERWYSSKKVQKVVNSTKMYGKVRNKMKVEKQANRANTENLPENDITKETSSATQEDSEEVPIIGSIQEYEKLFGSKIVAQNLDNVSTVETALAALRAEAEHSDAQSEEADDDDLWGDIIGST